jgi:biopolymer transport protein ExbB
MNAGSDNLTLLQLFRLGGIFMWPLLVFSIATIAIAVERTIYLVYHNLNIESLKEPCAGYIRSGDLEGAQTFLGALTKRSMGARILLAMIRQDEALGQCGEELAEHRIEKAAETEALECINSLENGFNFLTALGSLSPLTGFLGTVSGMIGAFRSIAAASDVNAQIVANGIYEALITTVFGLIIAIIAMIAHSLFTNAVDKFAASVEKTCSDLITEIVLVREAGKTT